jgi:glutamate 5-kinase
VLGAHDLVPGQILLTLGDTEERRRYLNARATMEHAAARGAVPVVNENDTVATNEIRYGDNDRLAARVATMVGADAAGAAVRYRRALHRPAHSDPDARLLIPPCAADHTRRSRPWPAMRARNCRAAA